MEGCFNGQNTRGCGDGIQQILEDGGRPADGYITKTDSTNKRAVSCWDSLFASEGSTRQIKGRAYLVLNEAVQYIQGLCFF